MLSGPPAAGPANGFRKLSPPRRPGGGRGGAAVASVQELAKPLREVVCVVPAQRGIADLRCEIAQTALQRSAPLRRVERLGLRLAPPEHLDERQRVAQRLGDGGGPAGAQQLVGVLPAGQQDKAQGLARLDEGRAVSIALKAALSPALSPSKQRIGSSAMRQSRPHWSGVSAVPSGATQWGKPAAVMAITST